MIQLPEGFDSIFRYIVVVSQRAEQLIKGAKARSESRHAKPTLIARDDVDTGQVTWRVLTQEELDARRQEIVDQFRAEVSGEDAVFAPAARIVDVLPTASPVAAVEERDDELSRLQRLLGMARVDSEESEEDESEFAGGDDDAGEDFDLSEAEPLDEALDVEDGDEEGED